MAETDYVGVFAQEETRERLARAADEGRFPQSLLLHGPRGVGKQRIALWSAALINCQNAGPRPCASCRACRLAGRLEHPDIHWFFPLPRPKRATSPEKLVEKLEDLRAAELAARRATPHYTEDWEGASGIYLAAVHVMRKLAQSTPAMGQRKVFVIGRAEALVPQLGSPEAANALLKLLEEPPADTTIILTSDVPGALLPTIRSRVQAMRIPPLADGRVREFLESELELPADSARVLAAQSCGSIGRALQLLAEEHEDVRHAAEDLVQAALKGGATARLAAAHGYRAFGARGAFGRVLAETSSLLRDLLAASTGAHAAISDRKAVAALGDCATFSSGHLVRALEAVNSARDLADRNINPQLIVVNLMRSMGVNDEESASG